MRNTLFLTVFCLMASHVMAEDDIVLVSKTSEFGGKTTQTNYAIPATRFFQAPTWDGGDDTIPLPMEKAITIARTASYGVFGQNGTPVNGANRPITKLSLENKNNRWWYVIEIKQPKGFEMFPAATVVVFMDGKTVDPVKR